MSTPADLSLPFKKTNLFARHWPVSQAKAVVGIIHGFGEHSGRYTHVADFFTKNGFSVTTFDLPGHGKTTGKRGHVDNYDVLLDSVQTLLDFTRKQYPGLPVFLFGHSMGGNILANFLIRRQPAIQGAVLQASWLRVPYELPKLEIWLAKTMRTIYPSLQVSSKLDVNAVSHDPAVVAAYKADALNHDKITPGWFFGAYEAQQFAINHAADITVPTLVMHGTADKLAGFGGSEELANNGGPTLTFKPWAGLYHELHNEPEQNEVLQYTVDWFNTQL
jgi:alpha-beta hydrolase superfamily lysophospholipase